MGGIRQRISEIPKNVIEMLGVFWRVLVIIPILLSFPVIWVFTGIDFVLFLDALEDWTLLGNDSKWDHSNDKLWSDDGDNYYGG